MTWTDHPGGIVFMICFDSEKKILTCLTRNTAYQMQIGPLGYLLHLYYGRRMDTPADYLYLSSDCGFSPNPYELRMERTWSMDILPQEYSGSDSGDFRLSALHLNTQSGIHGADFRVTSVMKSVPANMRFRDCLRLRAIRLMLKP